MFKLVHKLPSEGLIVACSGGVDSVSALHFLNKSRKVNGIIYINHNTGSHADQCEGLVRKMAHDYNLEFYTQKIVGNPPEGESKEAWWRDERYTYLNLMCSPIVLAHNLDDCVEEYVMNTIVRGRPGTIPYKRDWCIRPFRTWAKADIYEYAKKNKLTWLEDPSNKDTKYKRNLIRNELMPGLLKLNPGLYTVVRKMIENEGKEE